MAIVEHERPADAPVAIDELERLWEEPARAPRRRSTRLEHVLAWSWALVLLSLLFEPAPPPGTPYPGWAYALSAGFLLVLGGAAVAALRGAPRAALGAACAAGGLLVAIAISCRATEHHTGAWWAYELGASVALLGLGAVCLSRALRH